MLHVKHAGNKAIFLHSFPMLFRSLSIYMYNSNGSVNITQKGNSRCVKRLRSDIPSRSICEMLANFSRVEFHKPGVSKFRKRKKNSRVVHVLHKT